MPAVMPPGLLPCRHRFPPSRPPSLPPAAAAYDPNVQQRVDWTGAVIRPRPRPPGGRAKSSAALAALKQRIEERAAAEEGARKEEAARKEEVR